MKVSMCGMPIAFSHRLRSGLDILRTYLKGDKANVGYHLAVHAQLVHLIKTHLKREVEGLRILEIGCGQRAVQTLLFQAEGAAVTGIDMELPTFQMSPAGMLRIMRVNSPERALKSLGRHLLFDKAFFRRLARQYGRRLDLARPDVRLMNAAHMSFADNSFDFIYSLLVFEHIDDVATAAAEVNRVLTPAGLAFIDVHLFPSLSGGHNLEWANPDGAPSAKVPPWDHLREQRYPVNTYVNRLRQDDYRRIFASALRVVEETATWEGADLLTPELEEALGRQGYTREDLLTRQVRFLCRKRNGAPIKAGNEQIATRKENG